MSGPQGVQQALSAMRGRRALLVGDFVLDAYIYGETERVSREAPVLIVRKEREEYRLGAAANTAANLAALGLQVRLAGLVGNDEGGARLRTLLAEAHCDASSLCPTTQPTPVKTRILAGAFGTSRQQVLRLDAGGHADVCASELEAVAASIVAQAGDVDVIVVSDYGYGGVTGAVLAALQDCASAGKVVCVDSRRNLGRFKGMTAVTPNVPEAEAYIGAALHDAGAVERAGRRILEELQCQACLVTQGKRGMTLFRQQGPSEHIGVVGETEVTDVTGAGDSVIATLSAALAAGLGLRNGMLLANCAAGVVVTRMGTAVATPQDVFAAAQGANVSLEPWSHAS